MLDIHCIVLSGKLNWKMSSPKLEPSEDTICLRFSTAAFATLSERDAYEAIRAALRKEKVTWVQPSLTEWCLDLNGLAELLAANGTAPWLKRSISVKPEFKAQLLSSGPPIVGDAEFVFYLTPELMQNFQSDRDNVRNHVFISYSHADEKWLTRVRVHLRPLEKRGLVEVFDDKQIKPGERWLEKIKAGLERAKVAVLLISADFLASDFIAEDELPPLLKKAEIGGAKIIPLIVSPCGFTREEKLSGFQAVNDPSKSLASLSHADSEEVLVSLADAVEQALSGAREPTAAHGAVPESKKEVTRQEPQTEGGRDLLKLVQDETDASNRGITEIFDSPESGFLFFIPSLRESGRVYKIRPRLFREAASDLLATGWLYPPEAGAKTRLYEYKE